MIGMTMLFETNISLCHDAFWDLNVTWNTEVPDFTECFQQTVLVLAVCIFFAVLTLISLCLIPRNRNPAPLPWTRLNITKVVICITLIGLSISKLGINIKSALINDHVVDSAIFSSGARSITFILVLVLMFQHRAYGIRTSTLLCLFWLCFSVCDTVIYRSRILRFLKMVSPADPEDLFVLDMIIFPLIIAELVLSLFRDAKSYTRLEKFSPFDDEPIFSYLTFFWMNSTVKKGFRKQLNIDDIPPLGFQQKANYLWKKFEPNWGVKQTAMADGSGGNPSLAWTLVKAYWPWMFNTLMLNLICNFVTLVPPLILNLVIDFIASDDYAWKGYFYCVLLIFSDLLQKFTLNHFQFFAVATGGQIKSALTAAAYRKCLKMSSSTKGEFPSGAITNLVAVDVQRIVNFSMYFGDLVAAPMKIVLTMMLLWHYLGVASIAGIAIISLLMPLTLVSSNSIAKLFEKQMKMKDARLKDMNEILSGVKILKFYTWEIPFMSKIGATRNKELRFTLMCQFFYVAIEMIFTSAPVLVAIASFTTYILMDKTHVLSPSTAFVSLNLMTILKYSLFEVPDTISELIQTNISLGRLRKYLVAEEYNASVVGDSPREGEAVSMTSATLSWVREADPATLQDVNLGVAVGSLVAIIGPVGSGKSSLLSALLAEMYKSSGSINIKGSLAYVPQQAWILNKTVKQNILLVKPMDEKVYNEILDCCCLRPDFEILPGGDETEIGERGINLSGGQKQRISVARAVFQNADVYLLDDPLSAVDAHVRKDLFENVIGNTGLLRNKTRILVTHDISVLSRCDKIVSMKDGKIEEIGTYSELMSNCGSFMNFVQEHSNEDITEEHADGKKSQNLADDADVELLDLTAPLVDGGGDVGTSNKQIQYAEPIKLTEEEKMEIGKVSRGIYLKYVKNAGVLWFFLAISGIIAFEAFEIGSNVWLSEWSNDASAPNTTSNNILRKERLTVYGVLGVAQVLLSAVGSAFLVLASIQAARTYHSQMLHSVIRSPMHFFDTTPFGRIINRFSSDMDIVDVNIVYDIDGWLKCLAQIFGIFIVIGMNLPVFLPALIPIVIVYYFIQILYLNTSRQLKRLESITKSPIYSHLLETIQGTSSIKAYRIQSQFTDKLEVILDTHVICYFQSYSCNRWLAFWLGLLGDVVIIITCCLAIHSRDVLSASSVGLTITYAITVTAALLWLVRCNTQLENKSVSVERLQEYCSLTPEAEWRVAESDPGPMWPQKGVIRLEDYSTRYREGLDLVLNSINLEVLSNEKVGIVGRTGAGKSSITLALFRIVEPADGRIVIDDVDVSTIGLHALRSKITIIPQDPVLFTGSIRHNLDPSKEYSDDQIWQSLEQAHLKEFVSNLSEGLDFELTEGGGNLSVGQRQLACLARALLKRARVLVLDEATAAVDMDTDKLIQNTIRTEFLDRTVITIAHRLNTVLDYDKIVVMDGGRICEVGNPTVLLQDSQSRFHSMAKDAKLI